MYNPPLCVYLHWLVFVPRSVSANLRKGSVRMILLTFLTDVIPLVGHMDLQLQLPPGPQVRHLFCPLTSVCLTNLNWFMLLWNRSTFHLSAPTFIRNWPSLRCHIDITITITICRVCVALVTNTWTQVFNSCYNNAMQSKFSVFIKCQIDWN